VFGSGDTVTAGNHNDSIEVQGNGTIKVGTGHDLIDMWGSGSITAAKGHDTIYLGHGHDTLTIKGTAEVHTGTGCATVTGGTFEFNYLKTGVADYIAHSGSQTLLGAVGPTEYVGGTGKTSMVGGAGNDTFVGGSGHDTMVGGTGTNLFEFLKTEKGGTHVISNFVSGQDKLYLEGYSLSYLETHKDVTTHGGNTYIHLDGGKTTIELKGFTGLSDTDVTKGH
jgi:Ca2+-binding RTX toxin-like protein